MITNTTNTVPLLFNSYLRRKPFMDVCFFFYKKYIPNAKIYLTLDNDDYNIKGLDVNILTYDNISKTSDYLHECHSRYYRHYFTLKYFLNQGINYIINCMDDGWIQKINREKFNQLIIHLEKYNADRIDLCGPQPEYKLENIENDLYYINPKNTLPWYLTNQCSMWKVNSLLKIYEILGPSADTEVERVGSEISRNLNFKFLTFDSPVIETGGFQRNVGLSPLGKKLLEQYCNEQK